MYGLVIFTIVLHQLLPLLRRRVVALKDVLEAGTVDLPLLRRRQVPNERLVDVLQRYLAILGIEGALAQGAVVRELVSAMVC